MNIYAQAAQSMLLSVIVIAAAVFLTPHYNQTMAHQPIATDAAPKAATNRSENVIDLQNTFEETVLKNKQPVVVYFFAEWCPSCKSMRPVFEEVAHLKPVKDVQFVAVNIDQFENDANTRGVKVVPTFLFFKNGKELDRAIGYLNKEQLTAAIKKHFAA